MPSYLAENISKTFFAFTVRAKKLEIHCSFTINGKCFLN